jgi:5'-phosphate synthase pdxT subunit
MATSFHPEVDGDGRIHQLFVELVTTGSTTGGGSTAGS